MRKKLFCHVIESLAQASRRKTRACVLGARIRRTDSELWIRVLNHKHRGAGAASSHAHPAFCVRRMLQHHHIHSQSQLASLSLPPTTVTLTPPIAEISSQIHARIRKNAAGPPPRPFREERQDQLLSFIRPLSELSMCIGDERRALLEPQPNCGDPLTK